MFIQKITQLARSDKKVTVVVCYDDFNQYKKIRSDIDEDQHFLFNDLRKQFTQEKNITLEFVYIRDVLDLLLQFTKDNVNTFIFDFTFNDGSDEAKTADYARLFSLPDVSAFGDALNFCSHEVLIPLGVFFLSLGFWETCATLQASRGLARKSVTGNEQHQRADRRSE